MDAGLDAKQLIHLPDWAKGLCLAVLALGIAASLLLVWQFFGADGSRDWVLIGISGAQFLITSFVIAVILLLSQTDANIDTLGRRADTFLTRILPEALGRITHAGPDAPALTAVANARCDIFGHDYEIREGSRLVMRLWCGVNVRRMIVIYRFTDPVVGRDPDDFIAALKQVFAFSLGGARSVGYNGGKDGDGAHFERVPKSNAVAIWLTADVGDDFLTNPSAKLFWAQDVAMMTESLFRTAMRNADTVRLDCSEPPLPQ